jgi:hypothetical protein
MVGDVPSPARRWLLHAIAPGTPLHTAVALDQHGQIKLGSWRPFTARQVLAPLEGYIWAETTRLYGITVRGYDRLMHGTGDMRHLLFGRIPIATASGPDFTRSAAGRLASEIAFVPAAALDPQVRWRAIDDTDVVVVVPAGNHVQPVTLSVTASGALAKVTIARWAKVGKQPYAEHVFAAVFGGEDTFGGYTIPTRTSAGYDYGTDRWPAGTFITQEIDRATHH